MAKMDWSGRVAGHQNRIEREWRQAKEKPIRKSRRAGMPAAEVEAAKAKFLDEKARRNSRLDDILTGKIR